jgi:hypothetical protein
MKRALRTPQVVSKQTLTDRQRAAIRAQLTREPSWSDARIAGAVIPRLFNGARMVAAIREARA